MSITRAKQSSLKTGVVKYDNFRGGLPYTPTIGTATDGGTGTTVSVTFTGNNTAGLTYTALSTPGSLSATSTTSPITVTGLTSGTAYTFAVKATNSAGDSPYSAASNSVTPVDPASFISIASIDGDGTSATISFTSIPQTYKSLQVRMSGLKSATGTTGNPYQVDFRTNNDTGSNFALHQLTGDGSTASAGGATGSNAVNIGYSARNSQNGLGVSIIDIHDYASTTKYKTICSFSGIDNNNTTGRVGLFSGLWMSTTAVTSLQILGTAQFPTGSIFSLYGIKG